MGTKYVIMLTVNNAIYTPHDIDDSGEKNNFIRRTYFYFENFSFLQQYLGNQYIHKKNLMK